MAELLTKEQALENTLRLFRRYYNVKTEGVEAPFAAEAEFHAHEEGYFLMKIAKVSENDSREQVYFASEEELTEEKLKELDETAWTRGISGVEPYYGHKSSDVTLIVLADRVTPEARKFAERSRHYKSYKFGFYGFSQYRLVAVELSKESITTNRQGDYLKKLIRNIFSKQ